jgi:hypothetical protein
MKRRWVWFGAAALLVLAGLAVVLLASGSSRKRPDLSPPVGVMLGASVNRLFNDRTYGRDEIDGQLSALAATGATLARTDSLWELAEPSPPTGSGQHFNWGFDDHIVALLAAHGLRWLPILDYTAPWDRLQPGVLHSPPRSPGNFAAFAGALAARYGPDGAFWRSRPDLTPEPTETYEVWNEPDNPVFWAPKPDAAGYAQLYLATRAAIHDVEPGARVIVGGLTRAPAFLPALLAARPELAHSLDGVGLHPYGPGPAAVLAKVRRARHSLDSLGLGTVPLYVTEVGWTIHPAGALDFATARRRPRNIETTLAVLGHTDCRISAVVLYTWVTPERDPRDKEDWFGIHPASGASTPDSRAFAAGIRQAESPRSILRICQ